MHGRKVDKGFIDFATSACAGGASLGHKLDKVFEKDATLSYETKHNTTLKEIGATIGMRMDSRIVNWAIGKWRISEEHNAQDVSDSFELLNLSCAQPSAKLPGKPIRHLRNVLA